MQVLALSFVVSLCATLLIVRFAYLHEHFSADHDLSGVQKFHVVPVPRIGGLAIMLALVALSVFLSFWRSDPGSAILVKLLLCSLPAFFGGFIEDLTKRVGPKTRLLMTMAAASLAGGFLNTWLARIDIPVLDGLLGYALVSVPLTLVAVAGVANAINIVDGYNGLAAMVVMIMALAFAYVAYLVGDLVVWNAALGLAGALLGFLVWNYPRGLVFLGDGGAYLIGFWLAELAVLLVPRHPNVSAWFPLLTLIYPIVETLFSIWRRVWVRGSAPGLPDAAHLHQLIYKRLVRWAVGSPTASHRVARNAMTSPYLWMLSSLGVIPAVLFWDRPRILQASALVFVVTYIWLYRRIARFNAPRWLVFRRKVERKAGAVRQSKV